MGNSTTISISPIYLTREKSSFLKRMKSNALSGEERNVAHHLLHPVTAAREAHPRTQSGKEAKRNGDLKLFSDFRVNLYYLTKKKKSSSKQRRKKEKEMRERKERSQAEITNSFIQWPLRITG